MTGGIIAAVVGTIVVAAVLLSDSEKNMGDGAAAAVATIFAFLLLLTVIAARIGIALAGLSILLKLLGVMPVAAWGWGAILGTFFGLIVFLMFVVMIFDS